MSNVHLGPTVVQLGNDDFAETFKLWDGRICGDLRARKRASSSLGQYFDHLVRVPQRPGGARGRRRGRASWPASSPCPASRPPRGRTACPCRRRGWPPVRQLKEIVRLVTTVYRHNPEIKTHILPQARRRPSGAPGTCSPSLSPRPVKKFCVQCFRQNGEGNRVTRWSSSLLMSSRTALSRSSPEPSS